MAVPMLPLNRKTADAEWPASLSPSVPLREYGRKLGLCRGGFIGNGTRPPVEFPAFSRRRAIGERHVARGVLGVLTRNQPIDPHGKLGNAGAIGHGSLFRP